MVAVIMSAVVLRGRLFAIDNDDVANHSWVQGFFFRS